MPDSNRHSVNYSGRNEEEEEDDDDTLDIAGVFPASESHSDSGRSDVVPQAR